MGVIFILPYKSEILNLKPQILKGVTHMALKNYKSFPLLEEYLNYLLIIKGRSQNTVVEYRTDLLMFFDYRGPIKGFDKQEKYDVSNVDADYIKGITRGDMYAFI